DRVQLSHVADPPVPRALGRAGHTSGPLGCHRHSPPAAGPPPLARRPIDSGKRKPRSTWTNHYGEHDPVGDEDVPQWPGHVPKPGDGPSPPGPPADEGTDGRRTYQSHRHAEPAGSYAPAGDGETARQAQPDVIPPRNLRHGVADVCRQTILSGLVEGSDRICHC